jgi:hypothetical protein
VIIEAVESSAPPLRLPLGADAYARIDAKLSRQRKDLDAWREIGSATSFAQ